MTDKAETPAAAREDSTALLTWLISALNAAAGDVAATKAVMVFAPPDSELPICAEAVAGETVLAPMPRIMEPRLLADSEDSPLSTALEKEPWPISPPKGDSEMNVGDTLLFSEDVAGAVEAPRLPNRTLTLEAIVAVKTGTPISVVLCNPTAEVEEASKPVRVAVTLLWTTMTDDCDP